MPSAPGNLRTRNPSNVIWESHPSPLGMLSWYFRYGSIAGLFILILLAVGLTGTLSMVIVIPVSLLLAGLVEGGARLVRQYTTYQVSNDRVYTHSGILRRRVESAPINRIENVTIDQTMIQRMLKVGRVDFDTAGENMRVSRNNGQPEGYMDWWGIRHPESIAILVEEQMSRADQPQRVRARDNQQPDGSDDGYQDQGGTVTAAGPPAGNQRDDIVRFDD